MGLYDSVIGSCPHCSADIVFQSKAGECNLYDFKLKSVPVLIAKDLQGKTTLCSHCGARIKIFPIANINNIEMKIYEY